MRLRYANGVRVDLGASMLGAIARPRLTLQGTRGSYAKQSLDPQEAMLKALSLDPLSMMTHTCVGDAYFYARLGLVRLGPLTQTRPWANA